MAGRPKKGPTLVTDEPPPLVRSLRAEALALLEVTEADLATVPRIEHLLKGIAGNGQIGTTDAEVISANRLRLDRLAVIDCLSGSEEPEARAITVLRERLTQGMADVTPLEAYCVAARIQPKRLFGVISSEFMEQSAKATALLLSARHPEVVQATIDMALNPLGDKDRKMLHQAKGFVPIPRTSVTHVHGNVDARQQTNNVALLPPAEDSVKRMSDRFNSLQVIPTPPQLAEPVEESEFEDDDS